MAKVAVRRVNCPEQDTVFNAFRKNFVHRKPGTFNTHGHEEVLDHWWNTGSGRGPVLLSPAVAG